MKQGRHLSCYSTNKGDLKNKKMKFYCLLDCLSIIVRLYDTKAAKLSLNEKKHVFFLSLLVYSPDIVILELL